MATSVVQCRFCEHNNPPDASFCNRCGAQLNFAPCSHCGAVNESSAAACFQCGLPFGSSLAAAAPPEHRKTSSTSIESDHHFELIDEMVASSGSAVATVATPAQPANRAGIVRFAVVLGGIALGALILGMYAARREPGAPVSTTAPDPDAVSPARSISSVDPALPPPAVGRPRPIARSGGAASTPGAAAAGGGTASQNCTDGVAALGLCAEGRNTTSSPAQPRTPVRNTAGTNASTPRSTGAAVPCTQARAALGLCVMTTTTPRK